MTELLWNLTCTILKYVTNKLEQYSMFVRSIRMPVRNTQILYHLNYLNFTVHAIVLCTYIHIHIHRYSQHATIIKISQLNVRLRADNDDSCKNLRRSFRTSSAVHSKSSQRKGSSRSNPSLPATTGPQ